MSGVNLLSLIKSLYADNHPVVTHLSTSKDTASPELWRVMDSRSFEANGEDLDSLYSAIVEVMNHKGPAAVVTHRPMAPKIKGIEGSPHAHDAIKV